MKPAIWISGIEFSGGQAVQLTHGEKIILVGSNNSGKSQTLRELYSYISDNQTPNRFTTSSISVSKSGDKNDLLEFLAENAIETRSGYSYRGADVSRSALDGFDRLYFGRELFQIFTKNIDAQNRLQISSQPPSMSPGETPTHPQQVLFEDDKLMEKVSMLFRQAFGQDLMFDFKGGQNIRMHVGNRPPTHLIDRVGEEYIKIVRQNPPLNQQGDGMRSYAGILFEAVVSDRDITFLDEPEAFLHPPQMRRLGATLASEVKGQMFVATHSSDILRGFLEGTKGNLRIMRIRREGSTNYVTEAAADTVRELWKRPQLRYSNALEGIFHEQTIICEDDSDCRLLNAMADHLAAQDSVQWLDTAYVPASGKHGVPQIAEILRRIGVPTKAVLDADFLSERALVKRTVEAFGGEWENCEIYWSRIDAAVRDGQKPKSNNEIKTDIRYIIDKAESDELPRGDITEAMKQGAPWASVKNYGGSGLPKGQVQIEYKALTTYLESIGVYLVPVGEIENFCKEIGLHGPKFVTKLLSEMELGDPRLRPLTEFVAHVHKGAHSYLSTDVEIPPKESAAATVVAAAT